jgi:membrane-associated phospholipid phosphatase
MAITTTVCMKIWISQVQGNRFYFTAFLGICLAAAIFLLTYSKADGFLQMNALHSFGLDVFFVNYTFFGDGIFSLCLVALLFVRRHPQLAWVVLAAFFSSGLLVQILKNLIYAPRPRLFFEAGQYLHFIDGVSLSNSSGFPSGHTTSAFALATVLAFYWRQNTIAALLLLAAMLVGYSRIYLAQHFLSDVLAGACIGVMSGYVCYVLMFRKEGRGVVANTNWKEEMPTPAL